MYIPYYLKHSAPHPQYDKDLSKVLFGGGIRPAPFVFGIKADTTAEEEDEKEERYHLDIQQHTENSMPDNYQVIQLIYVYISVFVKVFRKQ